MSDRYSKNIPDPRVIYADIIDLPHHQSRTHPHMSLYDRAAQFAPFAALTGYEDMVYEEARTTDNEIMLEEWEKEKINQKLNLICDIIADGHHPTLSITYFVPDDRKSGGEYVTVTEQIKRIDVTDKRIILMKTTDKSRINEFIDIDRVVDIRGDIVDYLDEAMD